MIAATQLEPTPPIGSWEYREVMSKGVRPLAEKEPYKVACILINATANMIRLRTHQDNAAYTSDYTDIWWARLCESDNNYTDHKTTLVRTLTFCVRTGIPNIARRSCRFGHGAALSKVERFQTPAPTPICPISTSANQTVDSGIDFGP